MGFNLSDITKNVVRTVSDNSPAILSAIAVVGVVSTTVMAVKATPIAIDILEAEEKFRKEEGNLLKIDILDKVELLWKCYLPSALMGAITIASIVGSNHISSVRNTALISLIGIAETTLKEYQAKVIETIGENKEAKIQAEISQDTLNRNPAKEKTIILTGNGKYLCYDKFSGRYFRSDIENIRQSVNEFNHRLNLNGWVNINVLYELFGLENIELGDEFGWDANKSLLEIRTDTRQEPSTGEPALVIDYRVSPLHI